MNARPEKHDAIAMSTPEQPCRMKTPACGTVRLIQDHRESVAVFREKHPPKFFG